MENITDHQETVVQFALEELLCVLPSANIGPYLTACSNQLYIFHQEQRKAILLFQIISVSTTLLWWWTPCSLKKMFLLSYYAFLTPQRSIFL